MYKCHVCGASRPKPTKQKNHDQIMTTKSKMPSLILCKGHKGISTKYMTMYGCIITKEVYDHALIIARALREINHIHQAIMCNMESWATCHHVCGFQGPRYHVQNMTITSSWSSRSTSPWDSYKNHHYATSMSKRHVKGIKAQCQGPPYTYEPHHTQMTTEWVICITKYTSFVDGL